MSNQGFCTSCGAARAAGARFCTACGAGVAGAAKAAASSPEHTSGPPTAAIAMAALLLAVGGVAAYFSLQTSTDIPRAVPGSPGAPAGGAAMGGGAAMAGGAGTDGELPSGHPSIDLPKEVLDFLDGLAADAQKNPQSVDAAQKLTRARYRASVINESYRTSAEQALATLLALDPANSEGLRIAANLAYDGGDFPEAEKRFKTFLEKNPDDVSAITDLGSTQLFQERADDAIATYRSAIAKDGKFMQAYFNLGIALQKQNKKDDAISALRRAMDLAAAPEERQHIENALAEVEGRAPQQIAGAQAEPPRGPAPGGMPGGASAGGMPGGMPTGGMPGGMPMPPPAPDRDVPTNASTDFQHQAEKPVITHPIVGPRVVSFEWTGPTSARAKIADFPMDQMPPFARAKFKSGMAAKIAAVAAQAGVGGAVTIEIVDNASGRVMDTLDSSADAGSAK